MNKKSLVEEKKIFYEDVKEYMDKHKLDMLTQEQLESEIGYEMYWVYNHIGTIRTICSRIRKGLV